jgi:hypothetical protein
MENRPEMQRKLDAYLKVRVLFTIILGPRVSLLLSGVAKIVQHPKEYKLYWVHFVWGRPLAYSYTFFSAKHLAIRMGNRSQALALIA